MRIFLRYAEDLGFQSGVKEDFGEHQTIVSITVASVMDAIVRKANLWIKFSSTKNQLRKAKNDRQRKYSLLPPLLQLIALIFLAIIQSYMETKMLTERDSAISTFRQHVILRKYLHILMRRGRKLYVYGEIVSFTMLRSEIRLMIFFLKIEDLLHVL